ncbi:MAG: hypothetical protein HZB91_11370 [Elusimicrobia bacterium]|nr:hypothetical protein [Elusimicrobiota bacterium]
MKKTLSAAAVLAMALGGTAFGAPEPAPSGFQAPPGTGEQRTSAPAKPAGSPAPKAGKSWLKTWFQHLKQGLSESAVQGDYQKVRVTAVAAVRGTPQDAADQNKPSWKAGAKARKSAQAKAERQEFGKAVDLILEGKSQEGIAALDAFEKDHPKSVLLADVREAREKARQMEAAEEAPGAAEPVKPQ